MDSDPGICPHGIGTGDRDAAACAFYADPGHLKIAGRARKREGQRLSRTWPVRFAPETVAAIRRFSDEEGITVSAWVRRAVTRALERPAGLIAGAGRPGVPKALRSSLAHPRAGTGGHTFSCQHMSIGGVMSAECGQCGPMVRVA